MHAFDLTGRRASPAACRGSAPGDDVKAVRWFGPPATIVTFRQRDPFYVVDLSLPAAPRVLGALEIPGYSGYLHPVGDGRVIGVGQDADLEGSSTALQVSVFDVTDPTLPRRTANLDLGFGTAAAEADSRAFTYLPDRRLALVPAWLGTSAACPARRDPPCWILVRGEETRDVPRSRHFGDRSPAVPAVTGVVVDTSGGLRELGRFLTGASVVRVVPVGERLAVVTWSSVIMLDPDDMKPLGSVVLDGRDGITRS